MLLPRLLALLELSFRPVYARRESRQRAVGHALALLVTLGRRTIAGVVCTLGRAHAPDWSAEYKLFSRSPWNPRDVFDAVITERLSRWAAEPIAVAIDDTRLPRTGKRVPGAGWYADPLSPGFHLNLRWGVRMLHAAMLFPHYREGRDIPCRAVPVRFEVAPSVPKPGTRATAAQWQAYRRARRQRNLSTDTVALATELRARLDRLGGAQRVLVLAGDGSFCNRTVMRAALPRTLWLTRTRKDARLCFAAAPGSRRRYAPEGFTPEQIRQDARIEYHTAPVFYAGQWRTVRYKEVPDVLWRRGTKQRRLRLLVVAPQPYRPSARSRLAYRDPAYLLCTDDTAQLSAAQLLQIYFDRWQIEVNHREMKDLFGVGQAQVHSARAVARHPAFAAAAYSLLLIAGLQAFGPAWNAAIFPRPRWRCTAPQRPSALDLLTRLRCELREITDAGAPVAEIKENLGRYAYG